jgi:membrane fusion protein (multidrug efflux system)
MSSTTTRDIPAPQAQAAHAARIKPLLLAGAALAVIAAAALYAHSWWTQGRFIETTDDAYIGGNVTPIAPHVAGFVTGVLVTDNQPVRAGQPLITLDQRDYTAAQNRAAAVVAARLAALASLRAQYEVQTATIRQQQADLATKSALLVFATADATRYRTLSLSQAGSRQQAERTLAADQAAASTVTAASAGLDAAQAQLKVLGAQIVQADAAVTQARADLALAQLDVGYTQIRSPIDGLVGNRAAQLGAYVRPGGYLLSVIPAAGLWVDANFKEDQIAAMAAGQPATVVADILPGHVFHAHVGSIAPGTGGVFSVIPAENATGNFTKIVQRVPVRILLDPGDPALPLLRPGLSTTVSVDRRAP